MKKRAVVFAAALVVALAATAAETTAGEATLRSLEGSYAPRKGVLILVE